jgi:putative transposase
MPAIRLWAVPRVADITYLHLAEEFGYLAVILDAFSRKVVGMAGATGLEPATSGVTGRPFSNEINGTLDNLRTIKCDNSAKSLGSNQTNTSPSMFGTGKAKKPQPATGNSTPDQPVPVGTSAWAPSAALRRRALLVVEDLCLRQQLLLLQRRYPQLRLRNADRQ